MRLLQGALDALLEGCWEIRINVRRSFLAEADVSVGRIRFPDLPESLGSEKKRTKK